MKDLFLIWLIFINAWGLFLTYLDKRKATKHKYRIPEMTFYLVAFIGGVIGIELGMIFFRHKTKKASFNSKIHLAFILYFLILLLFI